MRFEENRCYMRTLGEPHLESLSAVGPKQPMRTFNTRFLSALFLTFPLWCATGCWTDARGNKHHLIVGIGFGVITTTNRPGVTVSDSRVLGVQLGPDTLGAGYLSRQRIIIDPVLASNVVMSVKANPFDLTVTHHDLNFTNWLPMPSRNQTIRTNDPNNRL